VFKSSILKLYKDKVPKLKLLGTRSQDNKSLEGVDRDINPIEIPSD